jgi:ABC-type polysaccharide/polyol phosphate export permease
MIPPVVIVQAVFLDGLVLALSALNVFYRDVQHLVGNVLTFLFFLCPIVYPPSAVPARFRFMLDLNPFALFTELYQMILIEGRLPSTTSFLYLVALSLVTWLLGALVHQHFRERFAEAL